MPQRGWMAGLSVIFFLGNRWEFLILFGCSLSVLVSRSSFDLYFCDAMGNYLRHRALRFIPLGPTFFVSSQALLFGDTATHAKILKTTDPKKVKALGRQVCCCQDAFAFFYYHPRIKVRIVFPSVFLLRGLRFVQPWQNSRFPNKSSHYKIMRK